MNISNFSTKINLNIYFTSSIENNNLALIIQSHRTNYQGISINLTWVSMQNESHLSQRIHKRFIVAFYKLNYLSPEVCKGRGLDKDPLSSKVFENPPVNQSFGKTPCPAKPDPHPIRLPPSPPPRKNFGNPLFLPRVDSPRTSLLSLFQACLEVWISNYKLVSGNGFWEPKNWPCFSLIQASVMYFQIFSGQRVYPLKPSHSRPLVISSIDWNSH